MDTSLIFERISSIYASRPSRCHIPRLSTWRHIPGGTREDRQFLGSLTLLNLNVPDMASLTPSQRAALHRLVRRYAGPCPDLEDDGSFLLYPTTLSRQHTWLATQCGGSIITIILGYDRGTQDDGRYIAIVSEYLLYACGTLSSVVNPQCNCNHTIHTYWLTPRLSDAALAEIHAYRDILIGTGFEPRQSDQLREREHRNNLRETLDSSSSWNRLEVIDDDRGTILQYDDAPNSDEE